MIALWVWALSQLTHASPVLPPPGALGSLFVQNAQPLSRWGEGMFEGDLRLGATQFFGGPQAQRQPFLPSLTADLRTFGRGAIVEGGAKLQTQAFFAAGLPYYIELPEAFFGLSRNLSRVQVALGRKQEDWSRLDDYWKLGVWQPRFRWDYLEPQQVGLTGFFARAALPWVTFTGYFSPLFIPERGAPIFFDNGGVSSPGPYFSAPSSTVRFQNVETPVRYDLQSPALSQILFHPGGALQTRIQRQGATTAEGPVPWGSVSYAYKPINQIILGSNGFMGSLETPTIQASLYPRILYHHLSTIEAGIDTEWTSFWVSFLDERPVSDAVDPTWTTFQQVLPATTVSAAIEWKAGKWFHDQARVGLSYLRQWGGDGPDGGSLTGSTSFFEGRYPFQNALSLGIRSPLFGDRFGVSSRAIYDFTYQGIAWSTDLQLEIPHWKASLGFDVLGSSLSESSPQFGGDFFSRYRGNNRIRAGVSYVF